MLTCIGNIVNANPKYYLISLFGKNNLFSESFFSNIKEDIELNPIEFNSDTWGKIFNIIISDNLSYVEFVGEDVFDPDNIKIILEFCKKFHDNDLISYKEIWAKIHTTCEELKSRKENDVEDLLDQLDVVIESNGNKINLGPTLSKNNNWY